jgi:uncharacterized protein (TIGR03067 family)
MRVTLLVAALIIASGNDDAVKKDLDKLKGTWQTVSLTYNGKDHAGDGKFRMIFKGDQVTVAGNDAVEKEYARLQIKLDPTTMPRCIDITVTGGVQLNAVIEGIYDLKGDELRLCAKVFGNERPAEFASAGGSSIALLVMKRAPAGE